MHIMYISNTSHIHIRHTTSIPSYSRIPGRAAKQVIRKTVEGSRESLHDLNCYCNVLNKIFTYYFIFSQNF